VSAPGLRRGLLAAVAAALAYAVTVVVGRSLARTGLAGQPVLACRFGLSAVVLTGVQRGRRGPLLPAPGERLRVPLLGAIYAGESAFFYAALGRGTAGAVALVFYGYPAIVAVAEVARGRMALSGRLVAALGLSVGGVLTVVAAGSELSIDRAGVLFAVGSAMTFTLYLVAGDVLVHRTDAVVRAAWTSGTAALASAVAALVAGLAWPGAGQIPELAAYGLANAAAFGLMFAAVMRIGPTRTAVLLNFEVLASLGLAALFLDETVAPLQLVGGLGVLSGSVLVGLIDRDPVPAP
jgi:drug/metabolite transporter (DMT)-like permease